MPNCECCGYRIIGLDLVEDAFYWIKYNEEDLWTVARAHFYDDHEWFFYDTHGERCEALDVYEIHPERIFRLK